MIYNRNNRHLFAAMPLRLQGQYSFVIYDSNKRQVFAARDPGGQQPLYFAVDEDDSAAFVNKPISVPGGESVEDWQEVPPGHFVAGKAPKLQQFALTPDQLYARQSMDLTEDEGYSHQTAPIPIKRHMDHLNSMANTFKSRDALDPVFAMSF